MKQYCILAILLFANPFTGKAQYFQHSRGLVVSKTFLDYNTLRENEISAFKDYQGGFELALVQNIGKFLSVKIPFGAGVYKDSSIETLRLPFYNVGAQAQLHLFHNPSKWWNPYLHVGANVIFPAKKDIAFQLPVGLGINFRLHRQVFLNWQSDYRLNIKNWDDHLQHQLGFVYLFGSKTPEVVPVMEEKISDSDGDGIPDLLDLCPSVPGLAKFTGCPDTDGDGIEDQKDDCPDIAGIESLKGCPDSDGDGVSDNDDECPNLKGLISNKGCPEKDTDGDGVIDEKDKCPDKAGLMSLNGCPDSDGDGISDKDDKCPNVPGLVSKDGCPDTKKDADNDGLDDEVDECPFTAGLKQFNGCPDSDGDGVQDKFDNCPGTPGPISNKGCPIIEKQDKETLDFATRAVQFDLGRATLKEESFTILDKIGNILKKYPDYNLAIGGHTDNTGSAGFNLELSEKRAKVCYEYFMSKGIKANRLSYSGYGPTKPVADNKTEVGRYLNRRVEFNLIPRN